MSLSYAIIGTGAIGGYYGARLQQSGCEVHFLLRSDYEQVCDRGITVESINGDFTLPQVNAYNNAQDIPPVDVAIIALKTTSNRLLPKLLPAIKPNGTILSLQNGLGVEADIAETLSSQLSLVPTILGGLCFICSHKTGAGHIRHTDYGKLLLGAHNKENQPCQLPPLLASIVEDFTRAKVAIETTQDLPMARWKKLVWNVPFNGLSVVLDATTEEMMNDAGVRSLMTTLMEEVTSVANTWAQQISPGGDRTLDADIVHQMLAHTETMPPYRTSMKIDYDEGRPLEIEAIVQRPINSARAVGVAVPAMEMLNQQLTFLNARNGHSKH